MNLENACYIAYVIREFRNFGLFKENDLYKVMFTPQDNTLIRNNTIMLLPYNMCKFITLHNCTLNGKYIEANAEINPKDFTFEVLKVLLKTNILKFSLKEEFKNLEEKEIVKTAKLYNCEGKTFKEVSALFNLDFKVLKEAFKLQQGGQNKKIKIEDLETLKTLI